MLKSGLGEDPYLTIFTDLSHDWSDMYGFPGVLEGTWLSRHGDPTFIMRANTLLGLNNHPQCITYQTTPL